MAYTDGAAGAKAVDSALTQRLIGQVIADKYRLDAVLGSGGMGAVFRATRLMIGDTVAVKILHAQQATHSPDAERFRREAQAAARLKHPNAVGIYDFGLTSEGLCYLVMELVEGQSLQELVRKTGPLPVSTVVEIAAQVCNALSEAHRLHVIHRDIKSSNIMVENVEHSPRVKVLDFGIAKLHDQQDNTLTLTGSVVGTPHYMSPEQCLGEELDGRSDLYSLGIVLYEMLCGVVPFNSSTSTAVIIQHVNQPPQSLRTLNMSVPQSVEAVVLRALAKKPVERPPSASALAEQLRAAASNHAVWPAPARPAPFIAPTVVSNPAASDAQRTMVLTAQGTSGSSPVAVYTPMGTASVAPAPASGQSRLLWTAAIILLALAAGSALTYIFVNSDGKAQVEQEESPSRPTTNRQPSNNDVTTTTSSKPAVEVSTPTRPPVTSGRRAYCNLNGVNLRAEPNNQSAIRKILGSGQQLIVLDTPARSDTVWVPRAKGMVSGEWREVQLADNPSIQGWVFSYFITYVG